MFDNPLCGSASGIDVAWTKPEIVARVGWDNNQKWGAYSLDGGKTWTPFKTMPKKAKGAGSIAVSADGTAFVWAPLEGPVVVSQDKGATWARAEGLPDAEASPDWAPVPFRPAADRVNPKKFYVLDAKGGQAFTSVDGGAHFTASPTGLPALADYQFSSASAAGDARHRGRRLADQLQRAQSLDRLGQDLRVRPQRQRGLRPRLRQGAPPARPIRRCTSSARLSDVVGFFRSDDVGATWVRVNDDQHQYGFCTVITGDPRVYGRVYMGTGGRGIVYGEPK